MQGNKGKGEREGKKRRKKEIEGELNHQKTSAWKHYILPFLHNLSGFFFCMKILNYFFLTRGATFRKKKGGKNKSGYLHYVHKHLEAI